MKTSTCCIEAILENIAPGTVDLQGVIVDVVFVIRTSSYRLMQSSASITAPSG